MANISLTKKDILTYQISTLPLNNVPKIEDFLSSTQNLTETFKISAFNLTDVTIKEPKLSQWDYLDQPKVEKLIKLKNPKEISNFINNSLIQYRKGRPKEMFTQLLTDVTIFCQNQHYDEEKTAAMLSQFYHTHIYFTSGKDLSAEKIYIYFKDLTLCHSLPFPPSKKRIFSLKEGKNVLEFFCKIYLRNLSLIKYICMANFALYLNYEIPPPPVIPKTGKDKKKDKKEKGQKKKKK